MIKVCIVSSYHISCGIAQYVEHIEPELRKLEGIEFTIYPLPVSLTRSKTKVAQKIVKQKYESLARQLKQFDVTVVQWEPGLYGISPLEITRHIKKIISASKRVLFVHHTVPDINKTFSWLSLNPLKILRSVRDNYVFDSIFKIFRKEPHKFRHIVQTRREKNNFELMGIPGDKIGVMPLAFLSEEGLTQIKVNFDQIKSNVAERIDVESWDDLKLVGCFGFLSPYKGIETAIEAIARLPSNYHLIIVGGLHPQALVNNTIEQPYLQKLLSNKVFLPKTKKKRYNDKMSKVAKRIHFLGALDNKDFIEVMAVCDCVVLPYAEVGQTSSGPASFALDMGKSLYCTHNKCFSELNKFSPGSLEMFEVGNALELAEKIKLNLGNRESAVKAKELYQQRYNLRNRAGLYEQLIKELVHDF